jgi:hypothetical protein
VSTALSLLRSAYASIVVIALAPNIVSRLDQDRPADFSRLMSIDDAGS